MLNFGKFSYLATILIFALPAVAFEWALNYKLLRRYRKLIFCVVGLFILYALSEALATRWGAWAYNHHLTLNVSIGTKLESFIYMAFVAVAVISATLIWAEREDANQSLWKISPRPRRQ